MELTINQRKEYLKEISVDIESGELDKKIDEVLKEYKDKIFLQGFRRGKVPLKIILRKLGKELEAIAAQEVIDETLRKIVQEKNLRLVQEARITDFEIKPDKSLHFTALLEVFPEFDLKEYKGIPLIQPEITGFDEEFERRVRSLQEKCAIYHSTDKPAENGNILFLDYKTFWGEEELQNISAHRFRLGDEHNFPELNEGLLGVKRGEKKEILVKIPETFPNEKIAGKEVRFEIFVRDIKEEELPELNEEFAQSLGYNSLTQLGDEIKRSILDEWEEIRLSLLKKEIEKYLLNDYDFEPPESLVEREISLLLVENKLPDDEETRKKIYPTAKNRIKLWLILSRIAEKENLMPTKEDTEEFLNQLSLSQEEKEKLAESQFIKEKILVEKVMNFLIKEAQIGGEDVLHTNRD
ncbi:MAG: trigger factor [candidate division WOR-3 bacterium]